MRKHYLKVATLIAFTLSLPVAFCSSQADGMYQERRASDLMTRLREAIPGKFGEDNLSPIAKEFSRFKGELPPAIAGKSGARRIGFHFDNLELHQRTGTPYATFDIDLTFEHGILVAKAARLIAANGFSVDVMEEVRGYGYPEGRPTDRPSRVIHSSHLPDGSYTHISIDTDTGSSTVQLHKDWYLNAGCLSLPGGCKDARSMLGVNVKLQAQLPVSAQASPSGSASNISSEICKQLKSIKHMPFGKEPTSDKLYNRLVAQREKVVPCLIDELTNEERMTDPRPDPTIEDFRVGDLAFFLLLKVTDVPFEQMLPQEVREKVKQDGVYAYFEFTETHANRVKLQEKWREWLAGRKK
ncbi:MAG TPA: hypothetical protein VGN16_05030 [Acidobacteriaceae bacterium]|jgi:hypothetical protein